MLVKLYLKAVILLFIIGSFYGVLFPMLVSAKDTVAVLFGLFGAVTLPAFIFIFIRKEIRKLKKCVKF